MVNERNKYLIKNTLIFAIGNFATKLISFFLVPLYTSVMTTSEYGIVDLLYTVCTFLVPLFTFNIIESVLRFSLDKENNNNKIISIACVIIVFSSLVGLITIPILGMFEEYKDYSLLFYFYLITFSTSQILLINLKGQEKLKLYSFGNFLYTLMIAIFNIILLLYFKMGTYGYFVAYIISNVIISIYAFFVGKIFKELKNFNFDKNLFFNMIKYSIVLIPTTFMWWIMNFVDRIMVTNLIGLSENGIYAISYKVPTILSVVSSIFTQAWLFSAIREKDKDDNEVYTNKMFNFLSFGTVIVAMFLLIIIKPLYSVYVADEFFVAWKYVPFLMIGYIFLNLATFVSTSYNVNKDSKGFLFSSIIGAIVNIILNSILIPLIGVYGAALATAFSYFCVFVYRIFDTKKYVKININCSFILLIILSIMLSILLYFDNLISVFIQFIILFISILIYKDVWLPILLQIFKKFKK